LLCIVLFALGTELELGELALGRSQVISPIQEHRLEKAAALIGIQIAIMPSSA